MSDVAALGLPTTQALLMTAAWYWDMNDNNRAWTKRWQVERPGKLPTMVHAGTYSAVLHYFKAVEASNPTPTARRYPQRSERCRPTPDQAYFTPLPIRLAA